MLVEIVPVRQEHRHTSLPACLRMVLAYLGRGWGEADLASLAGTRSVGTSALGALRALDALGCEYRHLYGADLDVLRDHLEDDRPVIAFLRLDALSSGLIGRHAVVVCGLDEDEVIYADPMSGDTSRLPVREFLAAWTAHAREGIVVLDVE